MDVAVFSAKPYDRRYLEAANEEHRHKLRFLKTQLSPETSSLAAGHPAVCAFVNDDLSEPVLADLKRGGTELIAFRCAGFNNADLKAACELGLTIVRVPAYSPHAVAEHTIALILALNRKIHRAHARVREGNLSLEGLLGFDLYGRTVGVVGTGTIGAIVARILQGFGCLVLAYDVYPNADLEAAGITYVPALTLAAESDIITLHCPLTPETHHLVNEETIQIMKTGVMLVNTSRGALVDTRAVIAALKAEKIGYLGLDVYEEEAHLFFEDLSERVIQDDLFARLLTFPNVLVTGHQAFFTQEALRNIADTTLANITEFAQRRPLTNEVTIEHLKTR